MYETLVFIPADRAITVEDVAGLLRTALSGAQAPQFQVEDTTVVMSWPSGFELWAGVNSAAHVLEESAELARQLPAESPIRLLVANSHTRVEVGGGNDWEMDHFNDFAVVLQSLEMVFGAPSFDQASGAFNVG